DEPGTTVDLADPPARIVEEALAALPDTPEQLRRPSAPS
ncbi:MAG: hypothetical protein QOG96_4377, partial [Pseudonocardiales bacterium]|nr:hypothetical protein [Pseudonocardiales bacterium]